MLPSPSLGPPLLSASWSPPLFCGMPLDELLLELDEPPPELDEVAAGAGVEELDFEPPPPQPATASAAATIAAVTAIAMRELFIRCSRRRRSGRRCCPSPGHRRCAAGSANDGASCDGACDAGLRAHRASSPERCPSPRRRPAQRGRAAPPPAC